MRYLYPCILVLIVCVFASCKSAKKAYQSGDYEAAMMMALDKLKSSPRNKKAIQTVQKAYPAMMDYYEGRIERMRLSNDPLKWDKILDDYRSMNNVYEEIQRTPAAKRLLPQARYFTDEYHEALERTLEIRYEMGEKELNEGSRESAMRAYDHFYRVQELRSDYREVRDRLEEARAMATIFVDIAPLKIDSKRYTLSSDFFMNRVQEYLRERPVSPFIQFLTPSDSVWGSADSDHILEMSFEDFVVGQSYTREVQADRMKDSVVLQTTEVKDTTITTYGTVTARLFGFEKEISSSGILKLKVTDTYSGRTILDKDFAGSFVWYDYWGYFEGDKRALDDEDLRYLDKRRPSPEPDPQALFIEFTRPIFDQVTRELEGFYARY